MPVSEESLFDSLITDFSPTLDSSLIAALLAEIERDEHGKPSQPTQSNIDQLRQTLSELALQADETQLSEFSDYQLLSPFEETISSWTTPDTATNERSGTSSDDSNSVDALGSPLAFLQAALPGLSSERLNKALLDHENTEIDLWDLIACILSEESIRELEERGMDGLESDDGDDFTIPPEMEWETVDLKKKATKKAPQPIKKKQKPKKVALADVRQQHQLRVTNSTSAQRTTDDSPAIADPWTQLSSLSSHLSTLIPSHPPSTFLSYFHSPAYSTSYDALRAALQSLCKEPLEGLRSDEHTTILFALLDIILPDYESSNDQHRSRVIKDIELAVLVTDGRGDEALDLVNLLRDLDSSPDLGIQHSSLGPPTGTPSEVAPPSTSTLAKITAKSRPHSNSISVSKLPDGPPPVPPPPPSKVKLKPPGNSGNKPSPYQWQAVSTRKQAPKAPQRIAHHLPTYSKDVNGIAVDRSGTKGAWGVTVGVVETGKGAETDADEFKRRVGETMKRRDEALREASRMWRKGGGSKMRNGEVAFYFAEQARQLQEVARQEALNAARAMVFAKRQKAENHDTIDLHGTTASEAITIVREILAEEGAVSKTKPMKIITGRGSHSVNNVSVLKPAIKKALMEDGWAVAMWDAGLVVRRTS